MPYRSVFQPDLFAGQTVLVTGAGSGIGRCTAHELAALGAHVALIGRTPDKLDTVRREILADGGSACAHRCDIRDEAAVIATVQAVLAVRGRIDGLVNNAGGQFYGDMKDFTTGGFEAVLRTNLTGGFIFMREVYNRAMAAHGGAIVNMVAAIDGSLPGYAHSGAARCGMMSLTETAACEWAASGVRVNAVAPGLIASSGFDRYSDAGAAAIRQKLAGIPLQRYGHVAEVSAAIVYLLSPAAAFVSGACLRVDGAAATARNRTFAPHARSVPYEGFHLPSSPDLLAE
ncbi:Short-chain dehydrogenase/reductase SDR [Cupriavidus taiwanensis]|uniref:Peroxisomal trans-2-enoyl-CoA reductase n=1 Tax=Cupriavidus taiwanensis TaxID=164546 RepID=A0A976B0W4_9BURK|nr:SDR family oxidoreductase [Cupriavidus taiwanensis]SOZ64614.1 Short-chain dehydrogenase/reductase SDR [Cupriavidus taiwanensis]SOZ65523.1 Short-chain dehydrogenase/reductase SDR [Cupriavidus taiwanensis]SOZ69106.1 Short-chain dehydrogenase/reductase SDR [Cupriavidus taiwanensis]SPA08360.1 Short-chain dehydrogenase/reductase SDR [Cupriavidus taiwanensis]